MVCNYLIEKAISLSQPIGREPMHGGARSMKRRWASTSVCKELHIRATPDLGQLAAEALSALPVALYGWVLLSCWRVVFRESGLP
jgi:hypothetical protein